MIGERPCFGGWVVADCGEGAREDGVFKGARGLEKTGRFRLLGEEGAPFGGGREVGVDVEGCGDFPVADVFEDDGPEFWWEGWPCSFLFGWGGRASLIGEDRDAVVEDVAIEWSKFREAMPFLMVSTIASAPSHAICAFSWGSSRQDKAWG